MTMMMIIIIIIISLIVIILTIESNIYRTRISAICQQ